MKWIRRLFRIFLFLLALLVAAAPFFIRPLDDQPYRETAFYAAMMNNLGGYNSEYIYKDSGIITAGWSKENITPSFPIASAGYGNRKGKRISKVHDSLFARAIVLKQNNTTTAIVSCDLLIIPPSVTALLKARIFEAGVVFENLYIGATHTHNSVGGWGQKYIGELFAGKYNEQIVELIANGIVRAVQKAKDDMQAVQTGFSKIQAGDLVINRLVGDKGTEDPWLRLLEFKKPDGTKAVLVSFSAHATTLSDTVLEFSRDYPGSLVEKLEKENNIEEAVFMAGCVGSMGPFERPGGDWQQLDATAAALELTAEDTLATAFLTTPSYLRVATIPLRLREPQWRFSENWCFRHWLWNKLYGDYPNDVKALRIGNTVMIGLPCDFSGELMKELDDYAQSKGRQLIVTSFNGGYTGYITKDEHYNLDAYETRVMNWFGPGNGAYFSEIVKKMIDIM
jgi:neutral ceramidase